MAKWQIKVIAAPDVIRRDAVNKRDIDCKSSTRPRATAYTSAHTKSGQMNLIAMANNFNISGPTLETGSEVAPVVRTAAHHCSILLR